MRAIDLGGCPKDFAAAYLEHVHAWERAARLEQEVAAFIEHYNSGAVFVESFLRGLVFDFGLTQQASAEESRLRSAHQEASARILSSYQKVEGIALSMGASLKRKP